ncbi:MAG: formylglycine-generating enzyme family protein, partial [Bacteroidaceae bacterium]
KYSPLINYYLPEVIKKARTYIMKLDIKKKDDGKAMQKLVVKYTPTTAMLLVDGQPVQGNMGYAEVELPVGKHDFLVANNGYFSQNGTVELNPLAPAKLNIELTPQVASNETPQNNNSQSVVTPSVPQQSVAVTPPVNPIPQKFVVNGVEFYMIPVEGGTFTMGATSEQKTNSDAKPAHQVSLSNYYIGETEVTQALWLAVMENNPSRFTEPNNPVESVSWNDCQEFINKINILTGKNFRLPTEAEWEYAARGGNKSMGYQFSGSNIIDDVALYANNSFNSTQPVKTKQSNELGIYDMSGNVREWCQDIYNQKYYRNSPRENPVGPDLGINHVCRGGGWYSNAKDCRTVIRSKATSEFYIGDLGLRLALSE